MNKRKILILGSDFGTIDLLREAHKMGLYVIVADYKKNTPTKNEADETWLISTTDINELEKKCIENNVSAITFGASDFNINNGRNLCKRLGLPMYCQNDKAWEIACNKREFKNLCKEVGAPVADDYFLTDDLLKEDLSKIQYPVVVKPVDKSGNRGMSYCKNETELLKAYKYARSISDNSTIIIERELHGPEFAVNYVMADGEIRLLYFSSEHSQPEQPENLYSIIDTTSYHLKQYLNEVNEKVKEVFRKAGCRDGIAWVETILDQDGNFYLLEMGYRFGGEMTYVPYEKVSGFNSIKWMLEIALGETHSKDDLPKELSSHHQDLAASYYLFTLNEGKINKIDGLNYLGLNEDIFIDCPKREGDMVLARSPLGMIRIYAKDIEDLVDKIEVVNSNLKAVDENNNNLLIYYDDFSSLRKEYKAGKEEFNH